MHKSTKLIILVAGVTFGAQIAWGQHLTLDLSLGGPIILQPNLANQEVPIKILNDSSPAQNLLSSGLNIYFSVVNTGDTMPGPAILSGVHFDGTPPTSPYLVPGLNMPSSINDSMSFTWVPATLKCTLWTPDHRLYGTFATTSGTATFPTGQSELLTLIFDTTGVGSGSYLLKPSLLGPPPDPPAPPATFYGTEILNGGNPHPTALVNVSLIIVPEPQAWAGIAALGLLSFVGYRRLRG